LQRHGFSLATRPSDWQIGGHDAAMQRALLDGWLAAAIEMAPERTELAYWHSRRLRLVASGRSALSVGHIDLIGWL
jgi:hypothetical protein